MAVNSNIPPLSESDFDTKTGALTETAPATDTASSGLNGRLQRIAQRLSTLISYFDSFGRLEVRGVFVEYLETIRNEFSELKQHIYNNLSRNIPLKILPFDPLSSDSRAYESYRVVKSSQGRLWSVSGYNSKTTAQFIQVFDSRTLPPDGAVPLVVISAPALANFYWDSTMAPKPFFLGISVCNSSTGPTKTIGSADCWFNVRYT